LLIIKEGIWFEGDNPEIENIKWVKGSFSVKQGGFPSIIIIKNIITPVPKKFEDVQEEMMTGYQEQLEKDWIIQLKEKYSVKVDSLVFEKVKKKISDE